MATEDYSLLDSPSHAQPHLHALTRHYFPSSSSSSPTTLPAADSATADYYPHASSFSDDSTKSNSKRFSGSGSPYYLNKKLKSAADQDLVNDSAFRGGSGSDYGKDREEWSDTAIACLLEAYTEKFNQLNRGNLRGRDWEAVAEAVGVECDGGGEGKHDKSVEQCKNKIDNLKKRYKLELQRIGSGGIATSHWHWFKKIEVIVCNSLTVKTVSNDDKAGSSGGGANSSSMVRQTHNRYTPSNAIVANSLKMKPASKMA
ncbi:hypothetical protein VNO78_19892 [Psophocarpus tetragonolobus]|uniref:Myb/SANT-like DNA-binding domain-containing protein n=1 Tax=Psophocarpus tetragonolobus TaxID=3891 RepID=A0AAN9XGP8_PSOTE